MNRPNNRKLRKAGLFISSAEFMDKLGFDELYEKHRKQVETMEKNTKITHLDTTMKGAAIGLLTYVGVKQGWSAEVVAALVPVSAAALSFISTKIGDKNTTLILKLVQQVIEAAPAKPVKKVAKKAPAKKAK